MGLLLSMGSLGRGCSRVISLTKHGTFANPLRNRAWRGGRVETAIDTNQNGQHKTWKPRSEILAYALAVLGTSTGIVACFSPLHVTNNWAANTLMFVPGATAAAFLLRNRQGFRSVGWGFGKLRYWLWALLLPVMVLGIALPVSIHLGYASMAAASAPISRICDSSCETS